MIHRLLSAKGQRPVLEPLIQREDYPAFHRLLGVDLPETHAEFTKFQAQKVSAFILDLKVVRNVEVKPDELERYCQSKKRVPDFDSLRALVETKAAVGCRNDLFPPVDGATCSTLWARFSSRSR
jgi:hypothetical protein